MKRYPCYNCAEKDKRRCSPDTKPNCALMLPIGYQMVDDERKMAGFHAVMSAFKLKVETYKDGGFSIVEG